jgi:glycosyltransferase involved in cell wall biosynthesis
MQKIDLVPLVSIVIPAYNQRADFFRAAIRSVLEQTYENLEVIVSDNHSTNGTSDVLAEFTDQRLRVVRPDQHLPMTPHFTFAGLQARGQLMSFLTSDDLVTKDWLTNLLPMFIKHEDVVMGFGEIANVPHEEPERINYLCRNAVGDAGVLPG